MRIAGDIGHVGTQVGVHVPHLEHDSPIAGYVQLINNPEQLIRPEVSPPAVAVCPMLDSVLCVLAEVSIELQQPFNIVLTCQHPDGFH